MESSLPRLARTSTRSLASLPELGLGAEGGNFESSTKALQRRGADRGGAGGGLASPSGPGELVVLARDVAQELHERGDPLSPGSLRAVLRPAGDR